LWLVRLTKGAYSNNFRRNEEKEIQTEVMFGVV